MKKIILSFAFLFSLNFALGQSILLTPDKVDQRGGSNDNIYLRNAADGTPNITAIKHGGSFTSPSPTLNGTTIFGLYGGGYGTTIQPAQASIRFNATETWATSAAGSSIAFATTLNGTNFAIDRFKIEDNGNIGIGVGSAAAKLHIRDGISGVVPNPASALFVEKNANNYLGLASPNGFESGILFGKPLFGAAAGGIIYTTLNDMEFRTGGNINRMKIYNSGDVQVFGFHFVDGFTKLGSDAPEIKMKKLTGTTSASQGASVNVPHGVTDLKILSIRVMVNYFGNASVPDGFNKDNGYECNGFVDGSGNIRVENKSGNSSNILSKPFTVLITYEF